MIVNNQYYIKFPLAFNRYGKSVIPISALSLYKGAIIIPHTEESMAFAMSRNVEQLDKLEKLYKTLFFQPIDSIKAWDWWKYSIRELLRDYTLYELENDIDDIVTVKQIKCFVEQLEKQLPNFLFVFDQNIERNPVEFVNEDGSPGLSEKEIRKQKLIDRLMPGASNGIRLLTHTFQNTPIPMKFFMHVEDIAHSLINNKYMHATCDIPYMSKLMRERVNEMLPREMHLCRENNKDDYFNQKANKYLDNLPPYRSNKERNDEILSEEEKYFTVLGIAYVQFQDSDGNVKIGYVMEDELNKIIVPYIVVPMPIDAYTKIRKGNIFGITSDTRGSELFQKN